MPQEKDESSPGGSEGTWRIRTMAICQEVKKAFQYLSYDHYDHIYVCLWDISTRHFDTAGSYRREAENKEIKDITFILFP